MNHVPIDLILANANVITCEPGKPGAEAIAIHGERIWRLGTNAEVKSNGSKNTQIVDCQGKTLVPGFIDAHCHFFAFIRQFFSLDLSPTSVHSIADIQDAIRRKARFSPPGRWVTGTDYNEFYLAEKRHPTRQELDLAAPLHPVILIHRSMHAVVLNSLGLKMIGIGIQTEEPPGGVIERDLDTGEPNGILFEMLEYVRAKIGSPISGAELDWGIAEADRQYLSLGITSIGEASVTNDFHQWEIYSRLKQDAKLKSRIYMMLGSKALPEFQKAGLKTGSGHHELRLGSVKIILTEATGQMLPSQEELNRTVLEADQAGFQVAIHAVQRSTAEVAVKALEYAQSQRGKTPASGNRIRHRIEHCSECPPALWERLLNLQAVIVSQPPFIYYSGERYLAQVSAEAQKYLYPFKSWLDRGLVVAGSSDSPVVPLNPLTGIYAAITRSAESGQKVLASEAVTARQALEMYTVNAAYASGQEKDKGSLAPGKLADIVMLNHDPLKCDPEKIKNIKVEMTLIGGKISYHS